MSAFSLINKTQRGEYTGVIVTCYVEDECDEDRNDATTMTMVTITRMKFTIVIAVIIAKMMMDEKHIKYSTFCTDFGTSNHQDLQIHRIDTLAHTF